ncbi:MAG: SUMF1/EgtB/PvdO family nonheme iron enzyme [Gammaproteobacteria bacterium]|nr:SUMF1/EgtB/PvdO family nonheme iron enzyme [Gammaproteobacteria bacterium]
MTAEDPFLELRQVQALLLDIVRNHAAEDYDRQYHSELSPLGWHLGHYVYTETYWIQEALLGKTIIPDNEKALYIPELSVKADRSAALPGHQELCEWALDTQSKNLDSLNNALSETNDSILMKDNYLLFFLGQHYAQHIETAHYVLAQRQLQTASSTGVFSALKPVPAEDKYVDIAAAEHRLGEANPLRHYDNECGDFLVELDAFAIAQRPLSNAEFLGFMEDGGYDNRNYWSKEAWAWRERHQINHPQHWRLDKEGNWYGNGSSSACALEANAAVSGISYFEAEAVARWAGASLPHEYQWEAAKRTGGLKSSGEVWEWCSNSFHPYTGFRAFPYDGYSLPWFDDSHYVLRGHSVHSLPNIRRDSFRNFYQPDKRHFPAGLRLTLI